jgi:uncharacterized protein (DUF983 family)
MALPILIVGMIIAVIAVALQYFVFFYSPATAILTTVVLSLGAYLVTQRSLRSFEVAMQYNLALDSGEASLFYKEIL